MIGRWADFFFFFLFKELTILNNMAQYALGVKKVEDVRDVSGVQ